MEDLQLDDMLADSFLDEKNIVPANSIQIFSAYNKLQLEEWCSARFTCTFPERGEQY